MIRLEYGGKLFKVLDNYSLNTSSREVKFSNIKIDFTNRKKEDLPYILQEIKVIEGENEETIIDEGKVLFYGFLNDYQLPTMYNKKEFRELTLNLLSPLSLATKRYNSITGTYEVNNLIRMILQPLINDGFVLKEINVASQNVTINYYLQTIEYMMNNLSNKLNLWWYIDENKNIYVYSLNYLFSLESKKIYDENEKIKGLCGIIPTVESVDYANVINMKNARVYSIGSQELDIENNQIIPYDGYAMIKSRILPFVLKKGMRIELASPIDTSLENVKKNNEQGNGAMVFYLFGKDSDGTSKIYNFYYENNGFYRDSNISFEEENSENTIVLHRDTFFNNLITSFTYNGDLDFTVQKCLTDVMLKYQTSKVFHSNEINKNKGIISKSGIVEKMIDLNATWFTKNDLMQYARNQITINGSECNIISLEFDENPDLNIGDKININFPNYFAVGDFLVTDINRNFSQNIMVYDITLRNASVLSNYIDLFRSAESEENEEKYDSTIINEYIEEKIVEHHSVTEVEE